MEIIVYDRNLYRLGTIETIHPYNGIENITSVARLSYTPRQQRTT